MKVFEELKERHEGGLIGFITLGDPHPSMTLDIVNSLNVDLIELGIPFSDPIADGPTIQKSSQRALNAYMNPDMAFEIAEEIELTKVFLTYYNIILRRGIEKFFSDCARVNVDGVIIPNLPIEESYDVLKYSKEYDVDLIYLVAPTTTKERLKKILKEARGFLYLVSRFGVTGEREELSDITRNLIHRISDSTRENIPLAVGFGISKPQHVYEVIKSGADAAIVGSAFVSVIERNLNDKENMLEELSNLSKSLKEAAVKGYRDRNKK
ncbi:MAG: tryptophan synthase subunit alpha [Candidatus Hydrothermarchaeota archaeon]